MLSRNYKKQTEKSVVLFCTILENKQHCLKKLNQSINQSINQSTNQSFIYQRNVYELKGSFYFSSTPATCRTSLG